MKEKTNRHFPEPALQKKTSQASLADIPATGMEMISVIELGTTPLVFKIIMGEHRIL